MTTQSFEFDFTYNGKVIQASCSVYKIAGEKILPYKYPLYRVSFNNHKINPSVFLFYEVNDPKHKFFAYKKNDDSDLMLKTIEKALERKIA